VSGHCVGPTLIWRPQGDTPSEEKRAVGPLVFIISPLFVQIINLIMLILRFLSARLTFHMVGRQVPVARVQQLDLFVGVGGWSTPI